MKEEIRSRLNDPTSLERLYLKNKTTFKRNFNVLYPEIQDSAVAQVWHARLNYEADEISWGSRNDLLFVLIASLLAGLLAKIPDFFAVNSDIFYQRNISFIVFPFLAAWFVWKQGLQSRFAGMLLLVFLLAAAYVNFMPRRLTDTTILAFLHLPVVMWAVLGAAFTRNSTQTGPRLKFLQYNGDLVVITTLILIAGGILSAVTMGLFELIGLRIEDFYMRNVGVFGLAAAPIVGTYLVRANPGLVGKISPVIARIFTPLVLVMLIVYLIAVVYTGKDPYSDRDFLLIFNVLLIGVMALILFSVTETLNNPDYQPGRLILFSLSLVTIVVNGIALSAIIFRITEWGITPNRLAVLGSNLLIFINLILVAAALFRSIRKSGSIEKVGELIARYIPVYVVWAAIVTFIFPILFNYR